MSNTSFFASHSKPFARAASITDEGDLLDYLGGLVDNDIFDSIDEAMADLDATMKAQEQALIKGRQDAAIEKAQGIMDGYSLPKAMTNRLASILDVMNGQEMSTAVILTVAINDDDETVITAKVIDPRKRASASASGKGKGKAHLDGKPLSMKLLRDEYPDSIAGRIAANKGHPFGIVAKVNGDEYAPGCHFNAEQAIKRDPILRERLTYID